MRLDEIKDQIIPLDAAAMKECQRRWDSIAKPLGSLGLLEQSIVHIAGITGTADVNLEKKAILVYCADNGIVAQGVTQTSQEVTAVVTENLTKGMTSVCQMAHCAKADVIPVDVGVSRDVQGKGLVHEKIAYGTKDFSKEPAMSREEAVAAIEVGIRMVERCKKEGYRLLGTGEMGIGNTTTSSAVASVLLNVAPQVVTGRGAGLSSSGLERKIDVITDAIETYKPSANDPIDILSKVGGFDLAALMGTFLGGAVYHIPVLVDGFISSAAALLAVRFCPQVRDYLLASHTSKEPAGKMVLDALKLTPILHAQMCLGEGTGTAALMPILDMACAVYKNMSTFEEIEIDAYQPLK